jgi:nitroreductase/FMN reductase [NAD(P)H]
MLGTTFLLGRSAPYPRNLGHRQSDEPQTDNLTLLLSTPHISEHICASCSWSIRIGFVPRRLTELNVVMDTSALIQQRFNSIVVAADPDSNGAVSTLLEHASCRSFTSEPVPDELMATLIGAAMSAPSKSDLQQVSVIRVTDADLRSQIVELSSPNSWALTAPELLVWCADGRRLLSVFDIRGRSFANHHLDHFFNATVDAAIAMSAFLIAAESVGLGCCPISEVRDQSESLSRLLGLPRFVVAVAAMAVGHRAEPPVITGRLPLEVTVHENRYTDDHLAELLTDYDARRHAADPRPLAEQRHVERFGVADEYGWSEDRTRQYAEPARADFGDFVRSQGFTLD